MNINFKNIGGMKKSNWFLGVLFLASSTLFSCGGDQKKGLGEKIEEAAEEVEDHADDAADEVEEAADKTAEELEEAAEAIGNVFGR